MSKSVRDPSVKGLRVRIFNGILTAVIGALSIAIFSLLLLMRSYYGKIIEGMDDYVECNKAISSFITSSEFMTNQSRFFAINHEKGYMDNYFNEINISRNREVAVEIVEMSHKRDQADIFLKRALIESNNLMKIDCYSMRLVCEALNISIPEDYFQLTAIRLTPEDAALSAEKKLEKAKEILFDSDYVFNRTIVDSYLDDALNRLINDVMDYNRLYNKKIRGILYQQFFLVSLTIVFIVFLHLIINKLVLTPLIESVKSIENGVKMHIKGAYEVNFIAKYYNILCEKNDVTANILKHKAEHDPLTGLINREAFNQIKKVLSDSDEPLAYLIVDIDLFKNINDKYGHLIGDDVLRKISNLLMEQFRATDYVARIGGDEFAIIMTKFGDSPISIIQKKIDSLNDVLQNINDGLPSVSLSVGVSISESGFKDILMEQADQALYRAKNGGRCNCSFFKQ